jgi:hypothetical protein
MWSKAFHRLQVVKSMSHFVTGPNFIGQFKTGVCVPPVSSCFFHNLFLCDNRPCLYLQTSVCQSGSVTVLLQKIQVVIALQKLVSEN